MSKLWQVHGDGEFDYNRFDVIPQKQTVATNQALLRAKLVATEQNEQKGECDKGT